MSTLVDNNLFYPYPAPPIEWNPNWYQNQPHHQGPMNPYQYGQGSSHLGAMPFVGQSGTLNHPQTPNIFQNPLQPHEQTQSYYYPNSQTNPANYYPNPYPQQSFNQKQSKGINSVMNSFKAQDGSVDINKMINTAGQMMNAVSQVSSMVKGLGGMLKV